MLPIERKNEILSKLMIDGKVIVSDLASFYSVTEETIRRDLEKLEREGKAIIIRPKEPIRVGRTGADIETLLSLHDEGVKEGREALEKILSSI